MPPRSFRVLALLVACALALTAAAHAQEAQPSRPKLYAEVLAPLVEAAQAARQQRLQQDPDYTNSVDPDLNANRLNIALLGYGEEHGQAYDQFGISVTILSLNVAADDLASISLSRDIRVTRYEDHALGIGRPYGTLRNVYNRAGFDGSRLVLQEATGLAIDYQLLIRDVFVRDYMDHVSGPVAIDVAKPHNTLPYRLDHQDFPPDFIPAGVQTMDSHKAMTFILAEDVNPSGRSDERSYRKNLLIHELLRQVKERLANRDILLLTGMVDFGIREIGKRDATPDFDFGLLSAGVERAIASMAANRGNVDGFVPEVNPAEEVVVHDLQFGDGGVRRVHQIMQNPDAYTVGDNPSVRREAEIGSIPRWLLVPIGGDPYSLNYVGDYWGSVRDMVRAVLTGSPRQYTLHD